MPANVVKTPADEAKWKRAKEIVRKQYGGIESKGKWPVVMHVFKNMQKSAEEKVAFTPSPAKFRPVARLWSRLKAFGRAASGKSVAKWEAKAKASKQALIAAKRNLAKLKSQGLELARSGKVTFAPTAFAKAEREAQKAVSKAKLKELAHRKILEEATKGQGRARLTTLAAGGAGAYALWPRGKKKPEKGEEKGSEKTAAIPKVSPSKLKEIAKLIAITGGTGLAVSTGKGYAEKKLEKGIRKAMGEKGKTSDIPWAAARGLTGAGSGVLYGLATALGLKGLMKK